MKLTFFNNCYTKTKVFYKPLRGTHTQNAKRILIYIPSRNMQTLQRLRNLLYRGSISNNVSNNAENANPNRVLTRNHTNWTARVRTANVEYSKNPPLMEVDSQTGFEIMRPYDASFKNHILLIDETYENPEFYLVRGSFTTSSTFYNDIPPEMVAGFILEGTRKPQFLHNYSIPRLIRKNAVVLHEEATISMASPEYATYLNTLESSTKAN